jgi:hypothetical protein
MDSERSVHAPDAFDVPLEHALDGRECIPQELQRGVDKLHWSWRSNELDYRPGAEDIEHREQADPEKHRSEAVLAVALDCGVVGHGGTLAVGGWRFWLLLLEVISGLKPSLEGLSGELVQEVRRMLGISFGPDHVTSGAEVGWGAEPEGQGRPHCEKEAFSDLIGPKTPTMAFHLAGDKVGASARRTFLWSRHVESIPEAVRCDQ